MISVRTRLRDLIQKLIESAILSSGRKSKPGQMISSLSDEDRELIRQAQEKDFYHRIN